MEENIFTESTRLFHSGKYEEGLEKISSCILASPNNSMLYSNRALFYYQLKSNDRAIEDLTTAINMNYLNYIAYFNLFSIELRAGGLEKEAFEDLCCSLSVLYLLRGKSLKTEIDVQKSIKYCENNIEAHILKAMMHLENNKLKLAANEVEWALEYSPDNIVLRKLRHYLHEKIGYKNEDDEEEENPYQSTEKYQSERNYRLECSLEIDGTLNIEKEIELKLLEFTEIYNDLNSLYGTVTQRIIVGNDEVLNVEKNVMSQVSGIWESGQKSQIFIQREPQKIEEVTENLENQFNGQASSKFLSDPSIYDQHEIEKYDEEKQEEPLVNIDQEEYFAEENEIKNYTNKIEGENNVEENTDFLIANEREEIEEEDFLIDQENLETPYETLNKNFSKKDSRKSYEVIENHLDENEGKENTFDEKSQKDIEQDLINEMEFQVPLPVPLNPENSNIIEENEDIQNQIEPNKEPQEEEKDNEGFLTSSDDTNHVPSYGEILTKENNNIEFHESQIIQPHNPTNQQSETVENTLINDLMSDTSRKSQESFNSFTDLENKNLIEERLKQIKERVAKNLSDSAKKLSQKESFENDIRSSEKLTEKSSEKIESIPLYPYTLPKKQIFFTFNNVEFSKKYKLAQLNEIYIVAVYHLSIPKYKMKTQTRKLEGTICNWNEKFAEMNLLEQPKSMKITVFNKGKGTKARDELLGEGEKEVSETGSIRLAIYDKKALIGYVKFAINLI